MNYVCSNQFSLPFELGSQGYQQEKSKSGKPESLPLCELGFLGSTLPLLAASFPLRRIDALRLGARTSEPFESVSDLALLRV
jgi:hypothetical protein